MRFSVLLSAVVLSFLFLMPQKGYSKQLSWPPPASEQLLQAQREAERAALYLADLNKQYNQANQRGDKSEAKRLKAEIKRMNNVANAARKDYEKVSAQLSLGRQLDYLCATNQNPGACRKCENGKVVIDDSYKPGSCMKCENGQPVYDNSYLSSCKRCLNGKVVALNGKSCGKSTECIQYICEQGRCQAELIPHPSNSQCIAAN